MAVLYVPYGTVRVSRRWRTVLQAADKASVNFHVTSGHRTIAEQWRLYNLWKAGKGNLAAFPSPNAPHIRTGRSAHALDVNALDGGEARLQRWLEKHGVHPTNPVRGEAWHIELSRADLARLHRKFSKPAPKPPPKPNPPKPKPKPVTQRTSPNGRQFIAREEGVIRYAYNDPIGHATFGVGHLIHRGNVTAADRLKWGTKTRPKSLEFTMDVFAEDLKPFEAAVRNAAKREMHPHRFDACVSLAFNIGAVGFANSTVAKELRANQPRAAADAFLLWTRAGNDKNLLRPRRQRERDLFLKGKY